jgi:hypothetical protein
MGSRGAIHVGFAQCKDPFVVKAIETKAKLVGGVKLNSDFVGGVDLFCHTLQKQNHHFPDSSEPKAPDVHARPSSNEIEQRHLMDFQFRHASINDLEHLLGDRAVSRHASLGDVSHHFPYIFKERLTIEGHEVKIGSRADFAGVKMGRT